MAYVAAFVLAFFAPWVSIGLLVAVVVVWLVPDRRVARVLDGSGERGSGSKVEA